MSDADEETMAEKVSNKIPMKVILAVVAITAFIYIFRGWSVIRYTTIPFYIHIQIIWGLFIGVVLSGIFYTINSRRKDSITNNKIMNRRGDDFLLPFQII